MHRTNSVCAVTLLEIISAKLQLHHFTQPNVKAKVYETTPTYTIFIF